MNVLSEIRKLSEEANLNIDGLQTIDENLLQFVDEVKDAKDDFEEFIQGAYFEYTKKSNENNYLMKKVDSIVNKLNETKNNIEQVKLHDARTCLQNVDTKSEELCSLIVQIDHVKQLLHINNTIQDVLKLRKERKFGDAIAKANDLLPMINSIPKEEHGKAVVALEKSVLECLQFLRGNLMIVFDQNISYDVENENIILKIKNFNDEMQDICKILWSCEIDLYMEPIKRFVKFIGDHLLKTTVTNTVKITNSADSSHLILNVSIANKQKSPTFKEACTNITDIITFLHSNLQYELNNEHLKFSTYIAQELSDDLSAMLVAECLEKSIPDTREKLIEYKKITNDIVAFEKKMEELSFSSRLSSFVANIDALFMKKKCESYLQKAHVMMKADLHNYMEVGTPYNPETIVQSDKFSRCTISKSTNELMSLIGDIMDMAPMDGYHLAPNIVQQICTDYTQVVPNHHKKLLQTIPQQVALYYNNCQYMAYELYNLQEKHKNKRVDFSTSILCLQRSGNDMFGDCVEQHKQQNQTIMLDCGLTGIETLERLDAKAEKCVRQCLRQQELLKTVWQKVLSHADYNRTIGYILNDLCEFLIAKTLRFVDISSEASAQLVEIIRMIQTRGLKLFTEPNEINLYVELWHKFKELEFVLNGNLNGINDRWADGKGPLALQFQPAEMRNLICALFQNTDVRASVLAKIN